MPYADSEARSRYNKTYYQKKKRKAAVDAKDERKLRLNCVLPASMLGRLQRLVMESLAKGTYPWKTMSQCVQTLLLDGLRARKGDDSVDEMLPHLEYMQQIDRIQTLRREAQGGLNRAREEISELLAIGAREGAIQYYHVTMEAARNMPPTEWRDWMIAELVKAFPQLAKEKMRGMRLVVHGTAKGKRR